MVREISGAELSALPSGVGPEKRPLEGAQILLEPLDPDRHAELLHAASHETGEARRVWTYLPDGPFQDLASFTQWVRRMAVEPDRLFFCVRAQRSGGHA